MSIELLQAALAHDIAATLLAWKSNFAAVSRIFLAAPGSNEQQLYKLGQPVFTKGDPRISNVPFVTKRPTLSEAKRVAIRLLTVFEPQPAEEPVKVRPCRPDIERKSGVSSVHLHFGLTLTHLNVVLA